MPNLSLLSNRAFVSNNQGIAVVDIGDIERPRQIDLISESSSGGTVAGFNVVGDTLLAFGDRFSVYSIQGGGAVQLLASYTGRGFVGGGEDAGSLCVPGLPPRRPRGRGFPGLRQPGFANVPKIR